MTEEQIKQNAKKYAIKICEETPIDYRVVSDAYIEGAYSRDEEVKHLERVAATYRIDAQDAAAECERLHDIIEQLKKEVKKD